VLGVNALTAGGLEMIRLHRKPNSSSKKSAMLLKEEEKTKERRENVFSFSQKKNHFKLRFLARVTLYSGQSNFFRSRAFLSPTFISLFIKIP
jgi:hypothetical protein